jgi:hypothetical protein
MELSTLTYPQVVYDGAVTRADLESWSSDLEELFTRMGPVFYRTESRRHAEQYLRGLLERRSSGRTGGRSPSTSVNQNPRLCSGS